MTAAAKPEERQRPLIASRIHLGTAITELEEMTAKSPVGNVGYVLGHILGWVQEGKTASEKVLPKIEFYDQQRLINSLLKIIDPTKTKLDAFASPYNGETDLQAIAKTRDKALAVLEQIDIQYKTVRNGIMPCATEVADTVCKLFAHVITDHSTVALFHKRITQWPGFLTAHGTQYRDALNIMRDDAIKHGDTPRMEWIDNFMRPDRLRAGGAKPAATAG
jgi:hypothetical protein